MSAFVLFWGWVWAARYRTEYDHLLCYWGNSTATGAMVGHRLAGRNIPFSILLHAGVDLYRDPAYLDRKPLYADTIFVVCEVNRQFVQSLFPEIFPEIASKIRLHRLGLDLGIFPFRPDEGKPATILCVGCFDRIKGFDDVLRAAAALRGRGVSLEVELIGGGAEEAFLRRLVAEHGLLGLGAAICLIAMAWSAVARDRRPFEKLLAIALVAWEFFLIFHAGMRLVAPAFAIGLAQCRIGVSARRTEERHA